MKRIVVNTERCKGCGLCIDACPKDLIKISDRLNAAGYYPANSIANGECTGCAICATVCPDVAIEVVRDDKEDKE